VSWAEQNQDWVQSRAENGFHKWQLGLAIKATARFLRAFHGLK